ncbi:MAG: damage-inducible protein DinB [Sphingobacteriales bacterium]|nr:MAG: damage-inducible protein DinB [Sphingobacteriales bacterium]
MDITLQQLRTEFDSEYRTTHRFFERFPEDQNDYAPHTKSMKLMRLASHIAELFAWPDLILNTDGLDFATGAYQPAHLHSREELVQFLEQSYATGKAALDQAVSVEGRWVLSNGDYKIADWSRYESMRHVLSQIIHHRAQLGVYYRLNDIAVPGSYGPSADDQGAE